MATFNFYGGTVKDENNDDLTVTTAQLQNSFSNLYQASKTFRKAVNFINAHETNPNIVIKIDDMANGGAFVADVEEWEKYYQAEHGAWPWAGTTSPTIAIIIDPNLFNGEYLVKDGIWQTDFTLERTLAHEILHVVDTLNGIYNSNGREEKATDLEDKVMHEAYPDNEPKNARGTYDNQPESPAPDANGPKIRDDGDGEDAPSQPDRDTSVDTKDDAGTTYQADGVEEASPLILDLDDSGTIDLISLANSTTYWDIDEDGFRELSGWVDSADGLLAIDLNENGEIDDSSELFGSASTDGFTELGLYDSNNDGLITAEDADWDKLIVWQDSNENAHSEESELKSLDEWNIVEIDLGATEVSQTNQGHSVTHTSTFTVDDGVNPADERAVHDVWFQYDNMYSVYNGSYDLDFDALLMGIDLRGYGTIPDLITAMSLDNSGTGNLFGLISSLNNISFSDLFDETTDIETTIKDIMFRWAGVDGVASNSRGPNIDAQELAFMEQFMGEAYLQTGLAWREDPGPMAALGIQHAFQMIFNDTYAFLLSQVAGGDLFEGNFDYDISSDTVIGITGIDSTVLATLETEATNLANTAERTIFWDNVLRMVDYTVGVSNLPTADQTALDDAITDSDASLDLQTILGDLEWAAPDGTTYNGTSGNDTLTGGSGWDTLNGSYGDDTLSGGAGSDTIYAGPDDDTLNGGTGHDYLLGSTGNDEYQYDLGDGHDIIKENGTGTGNDDDRIIFGSGIDSGDLTITRYKDTGLQIDIDTGTQTGSIFIENQINWPAGGGHVELIEFDDASTLDLTTLSFTLTGTSGDDTLYGARDTSSSGSDTIYGGDGNDLIKGHAPGETDTQENWLYGQNGNDDLYGGNIISFKLHKENHGRLYSAANDNFTGGVRYVA